MEEKNDSGVLASVLFYQRSILALSLYIIELYKLINWLTYSMVQSPSWAANWFAVSQEIPRISRNPKVHYRTHKRR